MILQGTPPVVACVDERLTTTSICLAVGYGARHDPAGRGGLAHLLEHLLMAAAPDGAASFAEYVERLGGHANAETGLEQMLFYARVHADDADETSRSLLRAVLSPAWDGDLLRSERSVVLSELAAAEADDSDVVQDRFLSLLFAGHPLGRPVGGSRAEVEALDLDAVTSGHRELFMSSPMTVFVTGPRVPAAFAGLPAPAHGTHAFSRCELPPAGRPAPVTWPGEYAWAAIGSRSAGLTDPDRHSFELLAHLLGGSPSSLLYRSLRNERGLAYMFQAWNRSYRETGAWRVLVGVEPGNGDAVVDTVRTVLEQAAEKIAPQDFDAARRQARMSLIVGHEEPLEFVRGMAQRTCAGTLPWSLDGELAALDAVTTDAVGRAAARVLGRLTVAVSPEV
ncbi:M16 family metallopeptidase [Streptomyces sp. NPDC101166]|uniref:M16 family metallopeptidase n=1 Tax=Streptomyces sp. NPDC101166 TaxID=3366120 RepID=UPI003828C3C0